MQHLKKWRLYYWSRSSVLIGERVDVEKEAYLLFFVKDEGSWCRGLKISSWGDEESRLILFLDVQVFGGNRPVFHVEDRDNFVFLKPLLLKIMVSLIVMIMLHWRMEIMKINILCSVRKKSMGQWYCSSST